MTQSRWSTEFQKHPFQPVWVQLKSAVEQIEVDDQTVQTSVLEVARLKRVIAYLDLMIATVDPELTPRTIWSNFHGQAEPCLHQVRAFESNKNITHIQQANDHADNLLTYLRPYEALPEEALDAVRGAAQTYVRELNKYVDEFHEKSRETLQKLQEDKAATSQDRITTEKHRKKIESYFAELFVGTSENPSIEAQIVNLLSSSKEQAKSIDELHATLLVGSPQTLSIQAKVKSAEGEIQSTRDKMNTLLDGAQTEIRALDAFHEKIFGKKDESGRAAGGLDSELATRLSELNTLEQEQKTKHAALASKIESLLPGATSAGLASSYKTLKDHFAAPIRRFTLLFYVSLFSLVIAAVVMAVEEFHLWPFHIKLVDVKEWDVIFRAMIYKTPFIAPVIWLALFSSTRRSQYERLQQEYAHKEALASSYESFKRQLEALKSEDNELQRELISKAIEAIAYNASITLDGRHQEKLPAQHILEKLSIDELKKLVDMAKAIKTT